MSGLHRDIVNQRLRNGRAAYGPSVLFPNKACPIEQANQVNTWPD